MESPPSPIYAKYKFSKVSQKEPLLFCFLKREFGVFFGDVILSLNWQFHLSAEI